MGSPTLLVIITFVAAVIATDLHRRACGETAAKICFGGANGGTPQNIDIEDLGYVAAYLRNSAKKAQSEGGSPSYFTMPSGFDCEEWTIEVPGAGTVLVLAKHINPRTSSSVLLSDIADTIDGGAGGTSNANALIGCGTAGGMVGVQTDPGNPLYNTDSYKASKAKPQDIIIKIVKRP